MENHRKKLKEEAIRRMRIIGISPVVIEAFRNDTIVRSNNGGVILCSLNKKELEMVHEIERKMGILVYFVIENTIMDMQILTMLCVSTYTEDWESETANLKNGIVFAYCRNLTEPLFSEFGSIIYKTVCGIPLRMN